MKRLFTIFLITFILFGMTLPASFVLASSHSDDNSGSSDSTDSDKNEVVCTQDVKECDGGTFVSRNPDLDCDFNQCPDKTEDETENENDEDDRKERVRKRIERDRERLRVREEIKRDFIEDGRRVEIERRIEVNEDGTFKIKIKRKITNADGTVVTKVLIIERDEDGIKKKLKIEGVDGLEVETELEIEDEFEGNESDVNAILSNGRRAAIKIMPDTASEIAIERLRSLNFTRIELKEIRHDGKLKAVYKVETNKNGRFLGIFKLKLKIEGNVDSETGEVLNIRKPWWAFLVSGEDSDQTDETETNEGEDNETDSSEETDTNDTNDSTTIDENESTIDSSIVPISNPPPFFN